MTKWWHKFNLLMDWLSKLYVNTLNVIHYMHDKYAYERIEMALHDRDILRTTDLRRGWVIRSCRLPCSH
uniref:Pyruvate formate lyase family protein n=1 Tax=Desertifilum tharense IPPAS B-1220 TaxID=1781255 RepID=A0ACD5H265_9CYAN